MDARRRTISIIECLLEMKRVVSRISTALNSAEESNPFRELLGPVLSTLMDALVSTYGMAILAVLLAKRWQSVEFANVFSAVALFPLRSLATSLLVIFWIYAMTRWFKYLEWPRWWAVPYVLLVLCPWAWVFARKIESGGDSLALLLLQSPVIVAYVWQVYRTTGALPRK